MPIICNYGFDNLGLHRIEGLVETDHLNLINIKVNKNEQTT
jgi:ribosomal-protein-alanine N-acetyltransferase